MTEKLKYQIKGRANHFTHSQKALLEFQEKILDGWRLDTEARGIYNSIVLTRPTVRIPLCKESEGTVQKVEVKKEEPVAETPSEVIELTEEEKVNSLREQVLDPKSRIAKDDLLWLAEKLEVVIPEDMKLPLQIKKHIKESLEA